MINNIYDYIEAGFRVFGVYGAKGGRCECDDSDCKALFKHPRIANWQNVPHWSDEQIETFDTLGHFETGFGVLCHSWLVIDVDARNGGVASFSLLCEALPAVAESAYVVNTGSGNGSQHHYFRLAEPVAMVQHLDAYPGIDFKTSGYVIGAGSMHASGMAYEPERGFPQDATQAPAELLALLRKPEHHRVSTEGGVVDVSEQDIADLLEYVNPDCDYESWVKMGMAVHHCLSGAGFDLWDAWSTKGSKYPGTSQLERHWHSFGKSANPAGYGTLLHYAREGGYVESVTFEYQPDPQDAPENVLDTTAVDLLRPPGFVGELTEWINAQCLYPRENLAVAAALCAVSGLAGMRYVDTMDDMSANIIAFCVAGSGTGKEAVQQAYLKIMRCAGVQGAVHGGFKSEQELMRNLIRHQAAFYSVDELGLVLRKLENASKRGGASYLEGIVGLIMSVYSKANGYLPITGDLKEEIREILRKELSKAEKQLEDLPGDSSAAGKRALIESEITRVREALRTIDDGLHNPYLTILGYTTPVTFNDLMGFEQATNGFMARAMMFSDLETNPKRKAMFQKAPMSQALETAIRNLYAPGRFDMTETGQPRIEHRDDKTELPTSESAQSMLDEVYSVFHQMAEEQKGATGLEAIPRRGYELAAKVSLILALPGGLRTTEHVLYGYALAMRDVKQKIQLAYATDNQKEDNGMAARILSLVTTEHGETEGVICNRLRPASKDQVKALLAQMVERGMLTAKDVMGGNNRIKRVYYGVA